LSPAGTDLPKRVEAIALHCNNHSTTGEEDCQLMTIQTRMMQSLLPERLWHASL
jgi:hypothetical protein